MKWPILSKPTMFSSAVITSLISAFLIFLVVEVMMVVTEDLGMTWNLSYILVIVVWVGVAVSMSVLYMLARKPMFYN